MPLVAAYHRPTSVGEALSLLAEPNRIPLAGGTMVNADREPSHIEVVDLQSLGLDRIEREGDRLTLGAMVRLSAVADHPDVPDWLKVIAVAEAPSTLRTLATVGGTVAVGSGDSLLLAAFLACDAVATLAPVDELVVGDGLPAGALITAVSLDVAGSGGEAVTGRTPADVPIVGAVAHRTQSRTLLALTGVADRPVLVDPADPTAGLDPPADFRGSAQYRLHLATVLSARALEAVLP